MSRQAVKRLQLRCCDLFCGGGGSSIGWEAAGFNVVLGFDTNAKARQCFGKNHPSADVLGTSIADTAACVAALRRADVHLATVSAPCQGFSSAGHQRADDPRNNLTYAAALIFDQVRTPVVVFENVPQVADSQQWASAVAVLKAAGYSISSATLDACNFGCAQRRVRFFAVATQPGYDFDFESAAKSASSRPRTRVRDVFPDRSHFYHFGRGRNDKCIYSASHESPPLRCNCGYYPRRTGACRARPSDDGTIGQCSPFSRRELACLQGWPASSWLPHNRGNAAKIIGTSVAPPVTAWIGSIAAAPFARKHEVARMAGCIRSAADLRFFQTAAANGWGHGAVQRAIEAQDAAVPGALQGPLPGSQLEQWLQMHRRVPDTDASTGAGVHVAQLQRRERRRLTQLLQARIRSDGTLRDLRDPIWSSPPIGAPPSSGNPAAHWANKPWRIGDVSGVPTHRSTVSQQWRRLRAAHMCHCERCQAHSESVHGHAPPLDALRDAHRSGVLPDPSAWTADPECYQCEMVNEVRIGLSPPLHSDLAPVEIPNGKSCWDEWDAAVAYMDKMDAIQAFEGGVWALPKGSVCSAMHMVIRPSDHRAFKRDGTPYPVRSVVDLTKSGVNANVPEWKFRMPGVDDAIALLGRFPHALLGTTDLSKYYPSIGLGPSVAGACWVRDPRADTVWRGTGPPSKAWRDWQAQRRASGVRYPPYRRCSGVPLGLRVAPAFACGLSGELVQVLTSLGIHCSMYVDDLILCAATPEQCAADMATAVSVFSWLGLRCNPDKQAGPSKRLRYLGLIIDTVAGTVSIDDDRRLDLLRSVRRLLGSGSCGTKDLETLIGKLGFAASVVRGGRAFLHRLRLCWSAAASSSSSAAHIDSGARLDAEWWARQLSNTIQGSRIFLTDSPLPVVTLKSDAAGEIGWGYIVDGVLHWSRWHADTVTNAHIQYKELVALVHCMAEYGERFANQIVRFGVDNSSVCYAANKLSSRCPTLMSLLRQLANAQCDHNCDAVAVHVSRQYNELADLATRFSTLQEFEAFLPASVATPVAAQTRECRTRSPADSEPVYCIRLLPREGGASSPPRSSSTPTASACFTRSATAWASRAPSSTSRSRASTSGTSPASTATGSCARTPPSPSTPPPSGTTPSTTAPTTLGPAPAAASPSSCAGSRTATRTSRSSSTRCSSRSSSASPASSASAPPPTSAPAPSPTSSSGRALSLRTTPPCAPSRTASACSSVTSRGATAAPSSPSAAARRSARSSTACAPCRSRTTTASGAPATCCAFSSAACTASPPVPPASSPTCRRTASCCARSSPGRSCAPASSAWPAGSASTAASAAAACAPAAQRTGSPSRPHGSGSSIKAVGSPTPTRSTTVLPRQAGAASRTSTPLGSARSYDRSRPCKRAAAGVGGLLAGIPAQGQGNHQDGGATATASPNKKSTSSNCQGALGAAHDPARARSSVGGASPISLRCDIATSQRSGLSSVTA